MMNDEKIYLRLVIEDGRKYVVDQHGREVADMVSLSLTSAVDAIDEVAITFYDHGENGEMIISGGHVA